MWFPFVSVVVAFMCSLCLCFVDCKDLWPNHMLIGRALIVRSVLVHPQTVLEVLRSGHELYYFCCG